MYNFKKDKYVAQSIQRKNEESRFYPRLYRNATPKRKKRLIFRPNRHHAVGTSEERKQSDKSSCLLGPFLPSMARSSTSTSWSRSVRGTLIAAAAVSEPDMLAVQRTGGVESLSLLMVLLGLP